jgi:hypothetical protein
MLSCDLSRSMERWTRRTESSSGSPPRTTITWSEQNALEDNVRVYRVVKEQWEQIKGADTKVASNDCHTLGLRAKGDRFTISFDGKQLLTTRDNTFAELGKVGLWTKADGVTYFDTISNHATRVNLGGEPWPTSSSR